VLESASLWDFEPIFVDSKRLTFESRVRVGSLDWLPRPLPLRFGRGFLPVRLQSFLFLPKQCTIKCKLLD